MSSASYDGLQTSFFGFTIRKNTDGKDLLMDDSKNRGESTPKWMVKIMENLIKMDDLGVPGFGGLEISPEPVVYNP